MIQRKRMEDENHNVNEEDYCVEDRKLSAIFQFAKAIYMPLLFEGVVNIRVDTDEKRKILDG